jgi:hypothetical protein
MGSACSRGVAISPSAQKKLSAALDNEEKSLRTYKPPSPKKPNFTHPRSPSEMLDQMEDEEERPSISRVSSLSAHAFEFDDEALDLRAQRLETLLEERIIYLRLY